METNLNHVAIDKYSKAFAEKVSAAYFMDRELISGQGILELCSIKQVNLFVVKNLLTKWKEESKRLESPYFDYGNKEVKKALKDFLNLLSQHIAIKKEHFLPILKKSVYESLLIILSPYDYYGKEINNPNKTRVLLKELKEVSKYIKINQHVVMALIGRFEKDGLKEVFNDEAFRILNEVFGEMTEVPEDIDPYVKMFSTILPLDIEVIYGNVAKKPEPKGRAPKVEERVSPKPAPKRPQAKEVVTKKEEAGSLNDKFSTSQNTLYDQLNKGPQSTTLAEIHQNKKITSIKRHVTLNQKFMFVNELFQGNASAFEEAINYLDGCPDKGVAMKYIHANFSHWDIEKEETIEFLEVINKKFD